MKRIKEIIVVEGKTDTALLKELFEVETIETHGLALDDKTLNLIKEASKSRGIIVLTDPDFPGKKIRDQIQKLFQTVNMPLFQKDATGKKVRYCWSKKGAVIEALENVVNFDVNQQSITWKEFIDLDIMGNKKKDCWFMICLI